LNFGKALKKLKKGESVRLPYWSKDVTINCQYPDEHSKMTTEYLYVESRFGRVPWVITQIELMSDAWEVVDDIFDVSKDKDFD